LKNSDNVAKEHAMNTGTQFVRADGKAEVSGEQKPLKILKAKEMSEGDEVVGTYKRTIISEKYGTPAYIIETEENDVLLNGSGNLNKQMANVQPGELIKVAYRGTAEMKEGKFKGTKSHLFTVFRAVSSEEEAG
jgi:hypothetical protein